MADYVKIFDTTLRDGEQSPGFALSSPQKVEMAHQLARLGVDVIEAGFPAASLDDVIAAGATTVNIADTCGFAQPDEFGMMITYIREHVANIDRVTLSVHCHDDLGLAVANSLAAIRAGARQVECCVNGIGERAGNAALEEIVMALSVRRDHHRIAHGINLDQLMP